VAEAIRHSAEVAIETGRRVTQAFHEATGLTTPTINSLLRELESRGIIKESTGRARDRVFVYRRYLEALAAEEEARRPKVGP
jgi:DNA-binding Lrp family transcriptional regulator